MNTPDWGWIQASGTDVVLSLRVLPNAKKSTWTTEVIEGACKIRIATPAIEGAANKALIQFLSKCFCVKQNQITIISGLKSRHKKVKISAYQREHVIARLSETL